MGSLEIIEKLKDYFKDSNYPFILLFGSFARDKAKNLSDIDIAIYPKEALSIDEMGLIILDLEDIFKRKIDLVDLKDLHKKNPKLAFNIISNHKVIKLNSKKVYDNFKYFTYKFYFDTKPLYELFDKALIERIDSGDFAKVKTS